MAFRYKSGVRQGYTRQGYIYFTSRRYKDMPEDRQRQIRDLCLQCGGEHGDALLEFVTTGATATSVCMRHYLGKSTLYRCVRDYYEHFPEWV